ncbi:DXO1 [Candida jiufengensis]|uniref:DXO1 n=1 Tax=Candida jiufengensis TaxID=497108 RepID=UPI002224CEF4|nr:DXO1 [Candida jiufengensis]KAI5954551.1 DXO1 [Candida jiufengensis]
MLDELKLSIFEDLVNQNYKEDNNGSKDNLLDYHIEPEQLCYYSKKSNNDIEYDNSSGLSEIKIPIIPSKNKSKSKNNKREKPQDPIIGSCLTTGFDEYIHPTLNEIYSFDDLFKSIIHLHNKRVILKKDFKIITLRRHLQKLMNIPLDKQEVKFNVIYWKGIIFFAYDWEENKQEEEYTSKQLTQRLLQYSGFKFEQILTEKVEERNENSNFFTVSQHKINNKIPIIYSAEIDCGISNEATFENYVELKTHSKLNDDKLKTLNKLYRKLMKMYCQNKFISSNYSVIGFRSLDFKLMSIKKYTNYELVGLFNSNPIFLTHSCSINTKHIFQWYNIVMNWIVEKEKEIANHVDKPVVLKLSFDRELELMDSNLNFHEIKNETETIKIFNSIIPPWFKEFIESKLCT